MIKYNNISIIKNDLRYKFAPFLSQSIVVSLDQKQQEIVESDRTSTVSLQQVYNDERDSSTVFRPTIKLGFIFKNVYDGQTQYKPFENQLFYSNANEASLSGVNWRGYPQYKEFDFIRDDYDVSGYTTNSGTTSPHVVFETKSATSYNWSVYLSYPHKNLNNITLQYYNNNIIQNTWTCGDGIPFKIQRTQINGSSNISFVCVVNHNLNVGEYVYLNNLSYNGNKFFLVDSLGDENVGSEQYIFNIVDIGYTGTTFNDNVTGTFKRVLDAANSAETMSKYYVREHKILTNESNLILNRCGFELNSFNSEKKFELDILTPNNISRTSEREGNRSYTITFNKDINTSNLLDNNNQPITKLYLTVINKGYFGWLNLPNPNGNALKFGYDFNFTNTTNPWWSNTNPLSYEPNIKTNSYVRQGKTFYYNESLKEGDVLYGDFCEWNDFDQTEIVLSSLNHKLRFNPGVFSIKFPPTPNLDGYYYQVHHPMTLRVYSTYVESLDVNQKSEIPNYSFFSNNTKTYRWRDIYTYGFFDELNVGVDYPFMNGVHYPYFDFLFKLKPEGYLSQIDYISQLNYKEQPDEDECEQV